MGWGGARPGSGPKAKRDKAAKPAAESKPRVLVKIGDTALARSKHNPKALGSDGKRIHPFILANHPPSVFPRGKRPTLAQDEAISSSLAWSAQAILNGLFSEGIGFLGYPYLAELTQRAEYRVVSETLATEATRKWIKIQAAAANPKKPGESPDDGEETEQSKAAAADKTAKIKAIEAEFERLKVQDVFRTTSEQDGFFGRSHVYIDIDGARDDLDELKAPIGDGRNKFSAAKVKKGTSLRLQNVEPIWCYPSVYNATDPLSPNWYNPETWFCMGKELHTSRLLTFVGREVPDLLKPAYSFGGLSLSQMAKPTVDNWLRTRQSVSDIVHAFSVMVLSTDMADLMGAGGVEFFKRMDFFNNTRDNRGLMAISKDDEDLKNVSAPLSSLDLLQAQAQEHMASVTRTPIVKLLGIQPAGLNASSEGEIKTWDDWVAAYQQKFFGEPLKRILGFVQLSLFGAIDEGITATFEPLRQMTEKEIGEIDKAEAEADQIRIDTGVIHPEEARKALAAKEDSRYAGIDPDDVPDLQEEEEQGLEPKGGHPEDDGPGGGQGGEGGGQDRNLLPFAGGADDALASDDFSEADHPRGQPGNAGQFGPGGGGAKKPKQVAHAPQFGLQHGHFTAPSHHTAFAPSSARRGNIGREIDPSKLKKVGGQKGSNPGGVYEDEAGKQFYVKQGKSKDHVRNEMIAAALYDLAGTPTLAYRPTPGGTHVATEMAKLDKDNASKLSKTERAEAAKDFAVHAWLGNWDVVGLGGDNLGTVKGTPTPLDLGGAMEYRAQGSPKGKAFGKSVGELDTLRDPKVNKDAAGIFGAMTPAEMRESARYVTGIGDDKIKAAVEKLGGSEALANKLIARKKDVAERAAMFGAEGDPKSPDGTMVVPAGGKLPVKELNGVKFGAWRPPADWNAVDGTANLDEPEFVVAEHKKPSTGVIIREPDGRVWVVQPRGAYGGYEGTFPKGGVEQGLSLQANAIKEAWEESGLKVRIVGFAGDHEGDMTTTRYYHAEREAGDPSKHDDETEGVVLVPEAKAGGFLNRQRDKAVLAHDEAPFDESKHKRDSDGKFSETGGGGGSTSEGAAAKPGETVAPGSAKKGAFGGLFKTSGKTPQENYGLTVADYLTKPAKSGSHYRNMLSHLIKEAKTHGYESSVPQLKEKLGQALVNAANKALEAMEAATDPKEKAKFAAIAGSAKNKLASMGVQHVAPAPAAKPAEAKPAEAVTKAIAEQALKDNPGMAAALKQKATPAELDKAKKAVALQVQYVPGFGELQFTPTKAQANDLVNEFNKKWAGKEGLKPEQLEQKVQDFKMLGAKVATLKAAESVQAKELAAKEGAEKAKQAAAQAEKNKKAAEALKAQQQAAKAKNQEYMKALGISETEASGFDALVEMMSESSSQADLIEKFKSYQSQAEKLGYPISGFQYALIRNYIDGGYHSINGALRSSSWSAKQHVYAKLVNNALDKVPKFTGTVVRGTTLSASDLAHYQPGHVVQEKAFTSTGVGYKFGGNVHYTIKAIGKRGADFSTGANQHEKEVLFKSHTFFLVHKVEKKGNTTHIHMEEVEGYG